MLFNENIYYNNIFVPNFRLQSFSRWLISNEKSSSAITCMDSYDFLGNDLKNLVIGKNDGNIEVYSFNINDNLDKPILIYSYVSILLLRNFFKQLLN